MGGVGGWIAGRLLAWRRLPLSIAANHARDRRDYEQAAALYGRALERDPARTDLRVQRANMLKDAGRFDEAESEYLLALSQRPEDADIHLQLGHLHKTRGHRDEAMAHYGRAQAMSLSSGIAAGELALLGDREAQDARFRAAVAAGGLEALLGLASDLNAISAQLDRIRRTLPEFAAQAAFPAAHYDTLRRLWDVPPPPADMAGPISVVIDMNGLAPGELSRMAASVFDQSHGEVELLLTGSERPAREWAARLAVGNHQIRLADIGARIADVIGQARHEMIVLTAPGARLHRHALAWFSWALGSQAAAAHVCDAEQVSGAGADVRFAHPALRQAVDHEILLQANPYAGSIAFDRRRCAAQISGIDGENSARFAFALLLELAFERSVGHIPYPLAAGPDDETQTPFGGLDAHLYARLVQAHLQRRGLADQVDCAHPEAGEPVALKARWRARNPDARLHLVIPTRDNGEDVRALVASLRATRARSGDTRITIVDNGSVDPATRRILSQVSGPDLEVWRCDEVFNWSRLSNLGAARQAAEIVVFVNDDMVMLTPGWDDLLRGLLDRPDVGVVGGKLLYPDQTIQHAGILFGWKGRAIHDGLYEARDAPGPGGRWQLRRRVAAVTGAFLAMRKPLFDELGGFDAQRLAVGYSDLDMALKARRRGLAVLYAPEIELTHYESKSRGLTHLDPTAAALDEAELAVLRARWPGELDADVCVHPAWLDATLPFRLLRAPDAAAVRRHIVATSCDDPWRPSASRAEIERLLAENPLD